MNKFAVFLLTLSSLAFASLTVLSKYLLNQGVKPIPLSMSVGMIMIPVVLVFIFRNIKAVKEISLINWKRILLIAFLATFLGRTISLIGQSMTSANNAGFLMKLSVLAVIIFSFLMLKERLSKKILLLAVVMLMGVFLITTNLKFTALNLGDIIFIIIALIVGFSNVLAKKVSEEVNPYIISAIRILIGSLLIIVVFIPLWRGESIQPLIMFPFMIAISALLGIVYLFSFYKGIEIVGPSKATIFFLLSAVFTPVLSFFFLGEGLGSIQLLGGALILIGAYFLTRTKEKQAKVLTG